MGTTKRFMDRFPGLMRAHGECRLTGKKDGRGKVGSRNRTVKEPATERSWEDHLKGKVGLGIVPVDEEGLTRFGAIDVDVYNLDLNALEERIRSLGFPLVVCRTKSGGAHLYLFLKDRAPAKAVRERLGKWAALLGHPKAEIFPKQDRIEKEDDCGSWINLPYFGDSRKAVVGGRRLTLKEFLDLTDEIAAKDEIGLDPDLEGAPPCLIISAGRGIEEGARNLGGYDLAVYCKMRYGDEGNEWKGKARELFRQHISPNLSENEIEVILKSVDKKKYFYKCKDIPINAFCDKAECAKAEYGMKQGRTDLGVVLGSLKKHLTDPPTWILEVNGKPLELRETTILTHQAQFRIACADAFNLWPNLLKTKDWDKTIRDLMSRCEDIPAPKDAGRSGEFMEWVGRYFSDRNAARFEDELITGKHYEEDGWIYFNSTQLLGWMRKNKFIINAKEAYNILRNNGAEVTPERKIKGKVIRLWKIPSSVYTNQDEPSDIPDMSVKPEDEPRF